MVERERRSATDNNVTHTVGAMKNKVLCHLSTRESKVLLINTQLISQKLPQVVELLTRIVDL